MFKLRKYQKEAVEKGLAFMNGPETGGAIIVAPTGSGKSLIISSIAEKLNGNTLVLQPSLEILQSNLEKAEMLGIENIGVYSASADRKDIGKLTFATIGSIIKKKHLFDDFKNLIIDESHFSNAKGGMYEELIKHMGGKVLGLTATPYRLHSYNDFKTGERCVVAKFLHRTRPRLFSKIIHITQIGELYNQKFLSPLKYLTNENYQHSEIKLNSTGMDFDKKSLEKYNKEKSVIEIAAEIVSKENSKHILVFVSTVGEAIKLSENINAQGISAEVISAKTPKKDRNDILKRFKDGNIRVVCNVATMTTGYDFPELDCIILGRPTQSIALYSQILGRGIRIAPEKKYCKVIDICGNVKKFGHIENFRIIEQKPGMHRLKSDKIFLTGYDFYHNKDVEASNYKGLKESAWNSSGEIVPFGKYKNTHISKIPNSYINWCVENMTGSWQSIFKKEKKRRNNK